MAGGWSRDGAEHEQMDATVNDAVDRVRSSLLTGDSAEFCDECGNAIPEARRVAVPGVQHCIGCQTELEQEAKAAELFNRRGSKDSQLR
ncbi:MULTISPECIES: DksA/TraR family C4-type zinc finger protein [unclassified Psychrobacter]|uniref:DksA/TraR family C4-type zinc finger protein n=1 Tax=unclassified Psychrobacter TaxID=196806 RepID=UPI0019193B9D|nr:MULTISPECIES: DksA/TraR family C4-type zinc finger protein [unclassified Psychrobacter]SNT71243.1 transcriptional regulator, TraR/DksA family [Psychrobacter sp. LV10R520-6]